MDKKLRNAKLRCMALTVMLKPKVAFLDEIDSGLDIDALKVVSRGINRLAEQQTAIVLVTHYQRILDYVKPSRVHVLVDGRVVRTGGASQALELEHKGYEWLAGAAESAAAAASHAAAISPASVTLLIPMLEPSSAGLTISG